MHQSLTYAAGYKAVTVSEIWLSSLKENRFQIIDDTEGNVVILKKSLQTVFKSGKDFKIARSQREVL